MAVTRVEDERRGVDVSATTDSESCSKAVSREDMRRADTADTAAALDTSPKAKDSAAAQQDLDDAESIVPTGPVKLFVSRLPKSYQEDDVKQLVATYGKVLKVEIIRDRTTNEPRGHAVVVMDDLQTCRTAIKSLDANQTLDESLGPVSVQLARHELERLGLASELDNVKRSNRARGDYVGRTRIREDPSHSKLFVGGLPFEYSEQQVIELFSRYGDVVDAHIICQRVTGRSKGAGFVIYRHQAEALHAIECLRHHTIMPMTRPLNIKFADIHGNSRNGRGKGANNQSNTNANQGTGNGFGKGQSSYVGPQQPQQQDWQQQMQSMSCQMMNMMAGNCLPYMNMMPMNMVPIQHNQFDASQMQQQLTPTAQMTMQPQQQLSPTNTMTSQQSSSPNRTFNDWTEFFTPENRPYYHRQSTGQTVWDKPTEFAAGELAQQQAQQILPPPPPPQQSQIMAPVMMWPPNMTCPTPTPTPTNGVLPAGNQNTLMAAACTQSQQQIVTNGIMFFQQPQAQGVSNQQQNSTD